MSRAKEFTHNAFFMTSSNLFNMLVALASMFFYTRILAPVELALIPILEIISSLVYVASNLGLGLYVQRRMPAIMEAEEGRCRELVRIYTISTAVGVLFCCLLLYAISDSVAIVFLKSPELAWQIRWMIPGILVTCWWTLLTQVLLGASMFGTLSLFSVISQVVHPLSIIILYLLMGPKGLLLGLAAGKGVVCLAYSWRLRSYMFGRFSKKSVSEFLRESWPFYLEGYIFYPMNFADRWLVGVLLTPVDLATYYVPRTMFERLVNFLKSFTNVMLANMSVAHAEGLERARDTFRQFRRVCIYLFIPLSVGMIGLSYYLVDLLAGPKYHAGIMPFALLMLALLVQGLVTPYYLGLITMLSPKKRLVVVTVQSLAVFTFVPLLGWLFGLNGVAGSRALIVATSGALSIYYMRELIPLEIDLAALRTILLPSAGLLAVLIVGQLAWYNFLTVPVYMVAGLVVYVAMFLRKLSDDDFNVVSEVAPTKLQWAVAWANRYRAAWGKGVR
jgi:O-antigen/teichoic acid export membrane protein